MEQAAQLELRDGVFAADLRHEGGTLLRREYVRRREQGTRVREQGIGLQ
jgi:hypothetical protein